MQKSPLILGAVTLQTKAGENAPAVIRGHSALCEKVSQRIAILCALGSFCFAIPTMANQFTSSQGGFGLTIPDGWQATPASSGRGVILSTAPLDDIPSGSMVPRGGALIFVQGGPPLDVPRVKQGDDDGSLLTRAGAGARILSRVLASDSQAARLSYVDDLLHYRFIETILHRGNKTIFTSLVCGSDDPKGPRYDQAFESVVNSVAILTATTPSP